MKPIISKAKSNAQGHSDIDNSQCFITRVQNPNPLSTAMTEHSAFIQHPDFLMRKQKAERATNQSFGEL